MDDIGASVQTADGVAAIIRNRDYEGLTIMVGRKLIPSSHVTFKYGVKIVVYAADNLTPDPTAAIQFCGTLIGPHVLVVSYFSSRGPIKASTGILNRTSTPSTTTISLHGHTHY
ncbi:hypothetical protein KSP39_PZI014715 [Platanthera zijinensis]|uniref:Uncharacterized protein n=1 Tax=Platanthera zijinensis TaxID=2320716 RepID=A0AAP0BA14_9ASPA